MRPHEGPFKGPLIVSFLLPSQVSHRDTNLVVGHFFFQGDEDRLEALRAKLLCRGRDFLKHVVGQPSGDGHIWLLPDKLAQVIHHPRSPSTHLIHYYLTYNSLPKYIHAHI